MSQPTPSEAGFNLDPRLAADCLFVTDLALNRVLLMNDRRYPWVILVPRRDDLREMHHLSTADQTSLYEDIARVSALLEAEFKPTKLNIGALGNIVSQLHIHIIARNENDPAWPGPVWGHSAAVAYSSDENKELIDKIMLGLD